jgi:release factor glutamine methyltransferase
METNLIEVLEFGRSELSEYSSDPEFESFIFLEEATGKSRSEILIDEMDIGEEEFFKFRGYLERRIAGEPWQYIVGKANFLGLNIFSERGVFIPRPETELMTISAIKILKEFANPYVLEIGCGTGAISIAIAYNIKGAKIVATDITKEAVNLCKKNVNYHNLDTQIDIIRADLLDCFDGSKFFDMIISNPPYVLEKDLKNLDIVVKNEPESALNGGCGGVSIINRILNDSKDRLKTGGCVFIEIDSSNITHINIPKSIDCSIGNDQYGRKRILQGIKV